MTTTTPAHSEADAGTTAHTLTLAWGVKRALIGIAILFVFVTGAILLFDAAIEPELSSGPEPVAMRPAVR